MATKTVYVQDEDWPLWDRLAEYANGQQRSVSAVLADIIRQFLSEKPGQA